MTDTRDRINKILKSGEPLPVIRRRVDKLLRYHGTVIDTLPVEYNEPVDTGIMVITDKPPKDA